MVCVCACVLNDDIIVLEVHLAVIALGVPGGLHPSRHRWQASPPYGSVREQNVCVPVCV